MINEVNNSVAAKERKFKMASGCDFFFLSLFYWRRKFRGQWSPRPSRHLWTLSGDEKSLARLRPGLVGNAVRNHADRGGNVSPPPAPSRLNPHRLNPLPWVTDPGGPWKTPICCRPKTCKRLIVAENHRCDAATDFIPVILTTLSRGSACGERSSCQSNWCDFIS